MFPVVEASLEHQAEGQWDSLGVNPVSATHGHIGQFQF